MEDNKRVETKYKPRMISVTTIAHLGLSALAQWMDGENPKRAFVPANAVSNDECSVEVLSAGIPYGAQWEQFIKPVTISPDDIANSLRCAGFWTTQDVERNPTSAQSTVNKAIGVNISLICRAARNAERDEVKHDQ